MLKSQQYTVKWACMMNEAYIDITYGHIKVSWSTLIIRELARRDREDN